MGILLPSLLLAGLAAREMLSSELQARLFHRIGSGVDFRVEKGPSPASVAPGVGPYDRRLGYTQLPQFVARLEGAGYRIERQARPSPILQKVRALGLFPTYREKSQAGLQVLDRRGGLLYRAQFPARVYETFEAIPELAVTALVFIENREMLDPGHPERNPAVDWPRLGRALGLKALSVFGASRKTIGGSTLATQLEKFRHSPEGRTLSAREKLRQMLSASLRAYQEGENTLVARRRIVLDYVNSVPLAAASGFGEVSGLGDGLWAWYGSDLNLVSRLLAAPTDSPDCALALKEVLSLFLAQRRPSHYLLEDRAGLESLTDSYLRLLAREGAIGPRMLELAVAAPLIFRKSATPLVVASADRKGANLLRGRLSAQLGLPSLYDLDRLDLTVRSTLDGPTQQAVTRFLKSLSDPEVVDDTGLRDERLLARGDPGAVAYAFTLYERSGRTNLVRVQTDNLDQPLDLNDGMKLNLGSTAKLRTLITYLEIVADLHGHYSGLSPEELRDVRPAARDRLSAWALAYLRVAADRSLPAMLEAALDRIYSASPAESFFTGGGLHTFSNFKHEDDGKAMTVREALKKSVNLVFVRLMRDVVNHHLYRGVGPAGGLLEDPSHPLRAEYLRRFADEEGREFLRRFYGKYRGKSPEESLEIVCAGVKPTPERLATILGSIAPAAGIEEFRALTWKHLPGNVLSDTELGEILAKYGPDRFSLVDRGYIARVHPLELWLLSYLRARPDAGLTEVLSVGADERQEVYGWLRKTSRKHAQDRRIAIVREEEAFSEIHASWTRLGYPFAYLTASLATALGSSGDRPSALAELMGILANDGVRLPAVRAERLDFAAGTPYETVISPRQGAGVRVLAPEVARAVRGALRGVVEEGTARRLRKALVRPDGTTRVVGGKTGTGDERFERFGRWGQVIESRFVSRAATFAFLIEDRFFGAVTAYVRGPESDRYGFTSALPVQILALLMPTLSPLLDGTGEVAAPTTGIPPAESGTASPHTMLSEPVLYRSAAPGPVPRAKGAPK